MLLQKMHWGLVAAETHEHELLTCCLQCCVPCGSRRFTRFLAANAAAGACSKDEQIKWAPAGCRCCWGRGFEAVDHWCFGHGFLLPEIIACRSNDLPLPEILSQILALLGPEWFERILQISSRNLQNIWERLLTLQSHFATHNVAGLLRLFK